MPEADSVERTAQRLNRLAGQRLTGCDLRWPSLATANLTGRVLQGTVRHGKHLLTRFEAEGTRPAVTLRSHLRMEGSWRVLPAGPAPRRHTVRAVLATAELIAVADRLGMLDLVRTDAEHTLIGHLGPDILDPDLDPAAVAARIVAATAQLGEALMDQQVVAGLGTVWVSEGLFAAGLNPWTAGTAADVSRVAQALAWLPTPIARSIADRRQVPAVYGRRRHPCPRCGTPIRRDPIGRAPRQRELFWCPRCQPG